jgi:hypothetical protein
MGGAMTKKLKSFKGLIGIVTLGLFVLGLVYIFDNFQNTHSLNNQTSQTTSYPGPVQSPATATPVDAVKPYPGPKPITPTPIVDNTSGVQACVFNYDLPVQEPQRVSLDSYLFTEPKQIYKSDMSMEIAQWLSDNQGLLVTYPIRSNPGKESIAVVDLSTGLLTEYGVKIIDYISPVWLPTSQAVAYTILAANSNFQLNVNQPHSKAILSPQTAPILSSPYLAVKQDGSFISISSLHPLKLDLYDGKSFTTQTFPIKLDRSTKYVTLQRSQLEWNNQLHQLAISDPSGLLFLDFTSANICKVELGTYSEEEIWPYFSKWSPNGRYLAMLTVTGNFPFRHMDLTVLDMTIGKMSRIQNVSKDPNISTYFSEITWAPDSKTLATLSMIDQNKVGLFIVDVTSGKTRQIIPNYQFPKGDVGRNLAWSPDGKNLVFVCFNGPLCTIEVNH